MGASYTFSGAFATCVLHVMLVAWKKGWYFHALEVVYGRPSLVAVSHRIVILKTQSVWLRVKKMLNNLL